MLISVRGNSVAVGGAIGFERTKFATPVRCGSFRRSHHADLQIGNVCFPLVRGRLATSVPLFMAGKSPRRRCCPVLPSVAQCCPGAERQLSGLVSFDRRRHRVRRTPAPSQRVEGKATTPAVTGFASFRAVPSMVTRRPRLALMVASVRAAAAQSHALCAGSQ